VIDVGNDTEIADELELQIEDSGLFGRSEGGTRKYNRKPSVLFLGLEVDSDSGRTENCQAAR
jgi:hypothetical protein